MWHTKLYRNCILGIAVFFTVIPIAVAQSYYHSPNDTIIGHAAFEDISVFNITQVHPTADTLFFTWQQQSVSLPVNWEASICDNGHCYTSLRDSGTMVPIVPGDNGLISLHINPKSEAGTCIIRYTMYAHNTPSQIDTLTWIITAAAPTGMGQLQQATPVVRYYHKQIIGNNLDKDYTKALLYDGNGKQLVQQNVQDGAFHMTTDAYGTQVLLLILTGKRHFITKILNY